MKLYPTSKYTEFYREPRAILNHNQTFFQWLMLDFFPLWISIIPTCDQNYISGFLRSVIFGRLSPLYNFSKRVIAIQNRLLAPSPQPPAPNLQYFHFCFRYTHYNLSDNFFASYLSPECLLCHWVLSVHLPMHVLVILIFSSPRGPRSYPQVPCHPQPNPSMDSSLTLFFFKKNHHSHSFLDYLSDSLTSPGTTRETAQHS